MISDEHKHDENCECHHDHVHNHAEHHHEHHHHEGCECGEECECGHEHSLAEELVESALIFSKKIEAHFSKTRSAENGLDHVLRKMTQIADLLSVDKMVLGHIKCLFESSAGKATISIVDVNNPTIIRHNEWNATAEIDSCTLSVNILSLAGTDYPIEDMLDFSL